jgi:hypothetical protein
MRVETNIGRGVGWGVEETGKDYQGRGRWGRWVELDRLVTVETPQCIHGSDACVGSAAL